MSEEMKKYLDKFLCFIGRHDLFVINRLSTQSDKLECSRCQKQYAINWNIRALLPWDREIEKFYEEFSARVINE